MNALNRSDHNRNLKHRDKENNMVRLKVDMLTRKESDQIEVTAFQLLEKVGV